MAEHTKSTLDGLYKDVYGDSLDSLVPDFSKLLKMVPFKEAKKTGRDFVQAVKLTNENGFTYGAGIQTLSAAISSDVDDAKVRGNSLTLRTAFSYDAAANMSSGEKAFTDATKFKFQAMMEAASARIEAQMLYGNVGLGLSSGTANASSTSTVLTFTDATCAPGIWAGAENAEVDFYDTTTLVNTNAALVVDSIDHDSKSITVTGASADITAIDAINTDGSGIDVYFRGAYGNEMVGLRSIVSNTGTLFGIAGASYSLWKGNTSAVGGNLTLKKIYDGIAKAVSKGLMEDAVVLVSPATYSVLANDQASLRRYGSEGVKAKNGYEAVEFHGQNGKIEIISHPMVKEGEAISFPKGKCERIGATDLTFKTPGSEGGEMFKHLADSTGYECRLYSEQAVFLPCPAKGVLFTGISN